MPKIDESDLDVGNEPPFVARNVVIKEGKNVKDDYLFSDELGRGRFGTVLKCTEKKSGLQLAAKFVSTRQREERENVYREVEIMKALQHRRLLQLYDVYDDSKGEMCIITELILGGELFERVIDDDFELTEKVCSIFMRQICEGVDYMHQRMIMHLDMKPENILCVSRTGNRIKLIDFGLARRFDPNKTLQCMFGTADFASPEVLSYDRVTPAADMWSVGVICYVLLSGLSPFMGNTDLETMSNVTKAIYDFDDDSFDPISAEAKDFISKLLIKDPKRRLKPTDCLRHKWLAKEERGKATKLSKTKLKKYVVRRRWQKAANAITALRRMGANLSLTGPTGPASPVARRLPSGNTGSGGGITKKTSSISSSSASASASSKKSSSSSATRQQVTQVANAHSISSKSSVSSTSKASSKDGRSTQLATSSLPAPRVSVGIPSKNPTTHSSSSPTGERKSPTPSSASALKSSSSSHQSSSTYQSSSSTSGWRLTTNYGPSSRRP